MRLLGLWILAFAMVSVPVHAAGNSVRKGLIPLAFPSWVELGPNPIPNGQTSPVNAVSGRVTAIEIDPADPNKVYVGAAAGGVFRSVDCGGAWAAGFDGAGFVVFGGLAL